METLDFYLGTYTNTSAHAQGIYRFSVNAQSGEIISNNLVAKCANPSFIAFNKSKTKLYASCEVESYQDKPQGYICEYDVTGNEPTLKTICGSGGKNPCHVMSTSNGKYVVATNYNGSSIFVADAHNMKNNNTFKHLGKSINPKRQEKAHPHSAIETLNGNFLIVADLGMDTLVVYDISRTPPAIRPELCCKTQAGSGPRCMVFHPNGVWLYLINELSTTIDVLECTDAFHFIQSGKITNYETADTSAADIHISENGKYLYASVRGNNFIAVFQIDQRTGKLSQIQAVDCEGIMPRQFALFGNDYLLCANQLSNSISVFTIAQDGRLTLKFKIQAPCPVCVLPI